MIPLENPICGVVSISLPMRRILSTCSFLVIPGEYEGAFVENYVARHEIGQGAYAPSSQD